MADKGSTSRLSSTELTFIGGSSRLARIIGRPANRFLHVEAASGIVLLIAAAAALIWANSPWSASFDQFIGTKLKLQVGNFKVLDKSLQLLVNDALMAVFFFVVGLEIKRELVVGQLREFRAALFPAVGAIGGMALPALVFFAFNAGEPGADGWGIPTATDIAFAVGVVSILGNRVPSALKLFLLTLAIVDDLLAISIIAIFYTDNLSFEWLAAAVAGLVVVAVCRQARVWYIPVYLILGILVWYATFKSGVHATIAGVALGFLTPAKPLREAREGESLSEFVDDAGMDMDADETQALAFLVRETVPILDRLITALHPWTSFVVIPLFAFMNAGIEISADGISDAATDPLGLGIFLGLTVGKTIGVGGATWLSTKLGFTSLPAGVTPLHMVGISLVAGIGFTVSIFVTSLAFPDADDLQNVAKMAIIFASGVAAIGGASILTIATKRANKSAGAAASS